MNPDDIEIKIVASVERAAVKKLYQQAGWWQGSDETPDGGSWIDGMASGSLFFAGAFIGGEMIGMGRAISDGASDAYIQDVTVLTPYRGLGIGGRLIALLRDRLVERGIGWIGLVAEPGTQAFYNRLGFEVLEGHVAMRLKNHED
ncbi:MAG: GNAT family N-acetyltransferase [Acidobacteria bacterium]|jgi:spermidine synthase|nr:GNAT family N-acetyltransferase [Acidobacteriota bacterium]